MSEAAVLPRQQSARVAKGGHFNRVMLIVVVALISAALLELAFALFISPNLTIRHLEVRSDFDITEDRLLSIAGIGRKEYYFLVHPETIEAKLAAYPLVKSARVRKVFPDKLQIVLKRRKPLAVALSTHGGKTVPVVLDEDGVVFQKGAEVTGFRLPVISGLAFEPILGLRLPDRLLGFLRSLRHLQEHEPDLFDLISEIKVVSANSVDYELIFYPLSYNMRINIGDRLNENILEYTIMVLDVLEKQELMDNVTELDFRSGEVIYRLASEED